MYIVYLREELRLNIVKWCKVSGITCFFKIFVFNNSFFNSDLSLMGITYAHKIWRIRNNFSVFLKSQYKHHYRKSIKTYFEKRSLV